MNWEWQLTEAQLKYCFGSCQPRKIFPIHHPPNRIGNKNVPLVGAPHRGPGCYLHEEKNNLAYNLAKIPMSNKGYIIGSRTSSRFKEGRKEVIPKAISPDSLKIKPKCAPPSYAPFNSISNRFDDRPTDSSFFPGPGTYNPETMCCRKVTWPMKFGSPDWAQVPVLKKRTLKTELITDKEFRIHRNREAYLSLYYS
ncbi:ciliary microtubule-associated protein 3 isoform X1 [Phascolarctos cinereus]|uniref:Protein pitchfork isoform X1 n=1 Tax=Phascolarctos cinereus TaxID=38626 RepID=A0A6P5LKV5_PHACI|nr:protein pitchfork isoform X1 [Phascolarctos cinereus]